MFRRRRPDRPRPAPDPPSAGLIHGEVVDLTHAFDAQMVYWPTEEGFQFGAGEAGVTDAGFFYVANRFRSAEHGGTHIDARTSPSRNTPTPSSSYPSESFAEDSGSKFSSIGCGVIFVGACRLSFSAVALSPTSLWR